MCSRVIKSPYVQAEVGFVLCTDNGGTSSRLLASNPSSCGTHVLLARPRPAGGHLFRHYRRAVNHPLAPLVPPFPRPTGDTSCFLICRTCCGKIVRENRVICPGGVNGQSYTLCSPRLRLRTSFLVFSFHPADPHPSSHVGTRSRGVLGVSCFLFGSQE